MQLTSIDSISIHESPARLFGQNNRQHYYYSGFTRLGGGCGWFGAHTLTNFSVIVNAFGLPLRAHSESAELPKKRKNRFFVRYIGK